MADRALRGTRIGANSLESEEGVIFAERFDATYVCERRHQFTVTFAHDAEPPAVWECQCGMEALLTGANKPEPDKPVKPQRTHWDMLRERRSIEELDILLDERIDRLRARRRAALKQEKEQEKAAQQAAQ